MPNLSPGRPPKRPNDGQPDSKSKFLKQLAQRGQASRTIDAIRREVTGADAGEGWCPDPGHFAPNGAQGAASATASPPPPAVAAGAADDRIAAADAVGARLTDQIAEQASRLQTSTTTLGREFEGRVLLRLQTKLWSLGQARAAVGPPAESAPDYEFDFEAEEVPPPDPDSERGNSDAEPPPTGEDGRPPRRAPSVAR